MGPQNDDTVVESEVNQELVPTDDDGSGAHGDDDFRGHAANFALKDPMPIENAVEPDELLPFADVPRTDENRDGDPRVVVPDQADTDRVAVPPDRPERVRIAVEPGNLDVMCLAAQQALLEFSPVPFFEHAGVLVFVSDVHGNAIAIDAPCATPRLRAASQTMVTRQLSLCTRWSKPGSIDAAAPVHAVVKAIIESPQVFPPVHGIATTPLALPDGSIVLTPGYHAQSGHLFVPPPGLDVAIPDVPTEQDIEKAFKLLMMVLRDFPFVADHHRAAGMAALLTPILRTAIEGCVPLSLAVASAPGSGKSYLVHVISMAARGVPAPTMAHTGNSETEKRITALLSEGAPLALIDNATGEIGGSALEAAITSPTWWGRILGTSKNLTVPMRACMYVTGNNLTVSTDMVRRTLLISMRADVDHPEERQFDEPDLLGWVQRRRGEIIGAVLTLFRAYHQAGCPDQKLLPMAGFDDWSTHVRSVLTWIGMDDPCAGRDELRATADVDGIAWSTVLAALSAHFGDAQFSTGDVVEYLASDTRNDAAAAEREELVEVFRHFQGGRTLDATATGFGYVFRRLVNRTAGGKRLVKDTRKYAGAIWRIA